MTRRPRNRRFQPKTARLPPKPQPTSPVQRMMLQDLQGLLRERVRRGELSDLRARKLVVRMFADLKTQVRKTMAAQRLEQGPAQKKRRHAKEPEPVARKLVNHFALPLRLVAFLTTINRNRLVADELLLDFECLDAGWWERFIIEHLLPNGGGRVQALFGDNVFSKIFFNAGPEDRALLYDLHRRFVTRILDRDDPGPVSLLRIVARNDEEAAAWREARWYSVELAPPGPWAERLGHDAVAPGEAVLAPLAMDYRNDPPPVKRLVVRCRLLERREDNLLKAVHLPQAPPPPPPPPPGNVEAMDVDEQPLARPPQDPTGGGWMASIANAVERGTRAAAEWLAPLLLPPRLAAVPGGALALPWSADGGPGRECRRPAAYYGRPVGALGVQMANPMVGGGVQPFVAICNIGQGNLNALYGNNGRIAAYFDFGFPTSIQKNTAPQIQYAPCLHDDPVIYLSHWDWDHYSMSRRQRDSWNMRWVAPQQHISSPATREVYGRVLASQAAGEGGEMHLWPGAVPSLVQHLRLPWGFLERGITNDQLADDSEELNNGGLAMYVCVKSAAVAAAPGTGAANAPLVQRGANAPACAAGKTAADAAVAAANALLLEQRCVAVVEAAAMAIAELNGGVLPLLPVDYARAAVVAVSALLGGGGTWHDALQAVAAAGIAAGPASVAGAYAVAVPVPGATAALAAAVGAGAAAAHNVILFAAAAAIADAAEAVVAAAGPPFQAAALAAARAAARAVANAYHGAVVAVVAAPAAAPAHVAQVTDLHLDEQLRAVAGSSACVAAEATLASGGAPPATAANSVARTAVVAVGRCAPTMGTWSDALAAMNAAGALAAGVGGDVLEQAAVALHGALGAAAASAADEIAGAGGVVPAIVAMPPSCEDIAAAAAIADAAELAAQSRAAVSMAVIGANAAETRAGADAGGVAAASRTMSRAHGQWLLPREVAAAARAAAIAVADDHAAALGGASSMQETPAPLEDVGAMNLLGFAAGPAAAAITAAGLGGATNLAGRQGGTAPVHANERYVILTGDVAYHCIPRQQNGAPAIIAITPAHHGADTCFPDVASTAHLPWAPGTPSAAAGAAAHAVRVAGGGAANTPVERIAAAAAYSAAEVAVAGGREPLTASIGMGALAAAALAAHGQANPALALAQVAATPAAGAALQTASVAVVALAGGVTAAARVAAAAASTRVAIAAVIAVKRLVAAHVLGGAAVTAAANAAAGVAQGATLALTLNAAAAAAVPAAGIALPLQGGAIAAITVATTQDEEREAVVAVAAAAALADAADDITNHGGLSASAATAARAAAGAVANDAAAAGVALAALPAPNPRIAWPGPGAGFGADGLTRVSAASVEAAVDAAANNLLLEAALAGVAATAVVALPRADRVAYSYGVRNQALNYRHYCGDANWRHPHPNAVVEYEARGWGGRLNTSHNAWRSAQPDPWTHGAGVAPNAPNFVSGDNLALGWEVAAAPAYEGPLRGDGGAGRLSRTCSVCGVMHFVC